MAERLLKIPPLSENPTWKADAAKLAALERQEADIVSRLESLTAPLQAEDLDRAASELLGGATIEAVLEKPADANDLRNRLAVVRRALETQREKFAALRRQLSAEADKHARPDYAKQVRRAAAALREAMRAMHDAEAVRDQLGAAGYQTALERVFFFAPVEDFDLGVVNYLKDLVRMTLIDQRDELLKQV
jgi:chaperonin cofactor prefoldin